jgi:hypothetical protein
VANAEKSRNWPKQCLTSKEREKKKKLCNIIFFFFLGIGLALGGLAGWFWLDGQTLSLSPILYSQ